jgi:polysaccharide export outer membrane protein
MNIRQCLIALAAVAALASSGGADAQPKPAAAPQAAAPAASATAASSDQNYVLGTGDVLDISVLGRTDFETHARISQDGTIQVPYLGTVTASNRTAQELGNQLAKALEAGGYFSKPVMKVDIASFASRYVTVLGEVLTPGLVPIDRPYHLSEILARSGGTKETAADYVVLRSEHRPERRLSINLLATGDSSDDPLVTPSDKIFVPKAELFYITGQIHGPGAFPLETGMTLRMAIGRGGGLTDQGTDHGVKVTGKDGTVRRLNLNDKIQAGDVILVGEKLF